MSFMSGLSNIFHGIGHIFDDGSDDQNKQKQQQQQQQQQSQKAAPVHVQAPIQIPARQNAPGPLQDPQKPNPNIIDLLQTGLPKVGSPPLQTPFNQQWDPNAPLAKVNPAPVAVAAPAASSAQPSKPVSSDHRNIFQKGWDQINPLDSDRSFKNGAPTKDKLNESLIHQVTHNPVDNTIGSLSNNILGTSAIIDTGRLGWDEAFHALGANNQDSIDRATTSLSHNVTNFIPIGAANSFKNGFGQDIATAVTTPIAEHSAAAQADEVRKQFNNHTGDPVHDSAVEAYASGVENDLLNQHLATAGIDQNTPLSKVVKKVGGDAASTAANIALLDVPDGGALLDEGGNVVKNAAGQVIRKEFSAPVKAAIGGISGGTASGAGTLAANPDATGWQLAKATAMGAGPGFILPSVLGKAGGEGEGGIGSGEIAPGLKSVNPDQLEHAVQQTGGDIPKPQAPEISPDAMHPTETTLLDKLNQDAKTRKLTPTELATRTGLQNKLDAIDGANNPKINVGEAPAPSEPLQVSTTPQPGEITQPTQTSLPLNAEVPQAAPASAENLQGSPQAPELQPAQPVPEPKVPGMAPNAPRILQGVDKETGGQTTPEMHEKIQNQVLTDNAEKAAATANLDEVVKAHSGEKPIDATTPQEAYNNASLARRLYDELPKNPDGTTATPPPETAKAMSNLGKSIANFYSNIGQSLYTARDIIDNLPAPVRASAVAQRISRLWGENIGKAPLNLDDVAVRSRVEAALTGFIESDEELTKKATALDDELKTITDDAANSKATPEDIAAKSKELDAIKLRGMVLNGQATRYYTSLVPKASILERAADWGKTAMLTSLGGRLNNVLNVGGNSAYEVATSLIQAGMGKAINFVKSDANALDTSLLNRGLKEGFQRGAAEFGQQARGNLLEDNMDSITGGPNKNNYRLAKTTDNAGLNKVKNFVNTAVNAPRTLFGRAIGDAQIERLVRQAGKEQGLEGEALDRYVASGTAAPTEDIQKQGTLLQDQVSHTNKNKFADIAAGIFDRGKKGPTKGAVGILQNTILPFAKFPATFAYNTLTDRNVIADTVHLVKAGLNHDVDGVTKALARGIVDGTGMYVGYQMKQNGMITNTNAEGYNDGGAYFKFGNHYIPIATFGVGGESVLGGSAIHTADHAPGNPLENYVKAVTSTTGNTLLASGSQSIVGADNPALKATIDFASRKPGTTAVDTAATVGAQSLDEFIPGIFSDVNAGLNMSPLNPTHEKADTEVKKGDITKRGVPSKAKDVVPSELSKAANKIPVVSQLAFPRLSGVAAPDALDRVTRGDHSTQTQRDDAALAAKPDTPSKIKAQLEADKAQFIKSEKETDTINGKHYTNYKGNVASFDDPQLAKQNLDYEKFKDSGKGEQKINGMVYQKGSDGSFSKMEQKDFDYKTAADGVASAKNSGDISGYGDNTSKLLGNISWQLQHANLTQSERDALTQKAVQTQEDYAKTNAYGGFSKPKGADTFSTPQIKGAKPTYVKTIQEMGAKYGVDINALMSVAAQEGLGGGVGDGGHAFGPFQMNDAGGVLTGKFKTPAEAQAYAESPAGIEDAVKQIAAVAKGKTGQEAIKAIVGQFERPANADKEIANAIELYTGGTAVLSPDGSVSVIPDSNAGSGSASSDAARLIKSNTIGAINQLKDINFNGLTPQKISAAATSQPIQSIPASSLIKQRTISVSKVR